jgi:hypothetical protein
LSTQAIEELAWWRTPDKEEQFANPKNTIEETKGHHHIRQLRHRLENQSTSNANSWILSKRRATSANQHKRVEHLFCSKITRAKLQKDFN